ncbi:hypothetical protein ATW7_11125 [Alteromonadales bacterium TW-7]|nr:hypothetical protein ATW7_11125 [Alteromonadales bacterium TW-7]
MRLQSFRVKNFRSINDTGLISTEQLTAILGRNESGKSNLLLALQMLNPPEGSEKVQAIKNFPRDRKLNECSDKTTLLETHWELSEEEVSHLAEIFPRAKTVSSIKISRDYGNTKYISFLDLPSHEFDSEELRKKIKKLQTKIELEFDRLEPKNDTELSFITDNLMDILPQKEMSADSWCREVVSTLKNVRKLLLANNIESDVIESLIDELEEKAESFNDNEKKQLAINWCASIIPVFIYVDDYPELNGHHNLNEYQVRKNQGNLTKEDQNFEKLCKVAGIDPIQLIDNAEDSETRNQLVNRASAVMTKEIKRLWRDRQLKVRFNIDSHFFDTYVSDPNSTYDVEVNLNERSRGFKWFFSFYTTFFADTNKGEAENAIILLDEPGLYLHAKSQSDLLTHLDNDFDNQIIFTTHSPFLVPTKKIALVKTVSIDEIHGTTVTNDPTGDSTTLFPLQAALGYDIAQSLFIGSNNLIVEGVTDFWYLNSISDYLKSINKTGLNENITITPAGGAQKVSYMVSLLSSQNLNVVVLLDEERDSKLTRDELVKNKIIHKNNVLFVSEALDSKVNEADIEDLLDRDVFLNLVKASYGNELSFNEKIPRVAKQVEQALRGGGQNFIKAKPAREFMKLLGSSPEEVMTKSSIKYFEELFKLINSKIKNSSRNTL